MRADFFGIATPGVLPVPSGPEPSCVSTTDVGLGLPMRRVDSVMGLDSGIGNESMLISDGSVIDALSSRNGVVLGEVRRGKS